MDRAAGEAEGLGCGLFGNGSTVAADLATGDAEFGVTEDVGLVSVSRILEQNRGKGDIQRRC